MTFWYKGLKKELEHAIFSSKMSHKSVPDISAFKKRVLGFWQIETAGICLALIVEYSNQNDWPHMLIAEEVIWIGHLT